MARNCAWGPDRLFAAQTQYFAGLGRYLSTHGNVLLLIFAIGALFFGGLTVGVLEIKSETDISELYVHGNSRLQRELDVNEEFFGGVPRLQSTIHVSASKNMATKTSLRAMLAGLTPVFKLDESANCAAFDGLDGGTVTTLPACDFVPYNTSALHCRCLEETRSPSQVVVNATTDSDTITTIHESDLCEAPEPPLALRPSTQPSTRITEDDSETQPVFLSARAAELTTLEAALSGDLTVYQSQKTTLLAACATAMQTAEDARLTNGDLEVDIVSSTQTCVGQVAVALGVAYSKAEDPTLDDTGLATMWAARLLGETDPTNLETAYGVPASATAAVTSLTNSQGTVIPAATAIGSATARGFLASQYFFASQGNVISYGISALAQCTSKFVTDQGSATISASIRPFVVAQNEATSTGLAAAQAYDAALSTMTTFQVPALDAAYAVWINVTDPLQPTPADTFAALSVFLQADAVTYNALVDADVAANRATLETTNATQLLGIRAVQAAMLQAWTDSNNTLDVPNLRVPGPANSALVFSLSKAYETTVGNFPTEIFREILAGDASIIGFQLHYAIAVEAVVAVAEAVVKERAAAESFNFDLMTVNGTVRPLPKQWGVDRFPCSRITPLDMFHEGGFDYPWALKQLEQVLPGLATFYTADYFAPWATQSKCMDLEYTVALKQATYYNLLGADLSYKSSNFPHLKAAEDEFLSTFAATGSETTAAGAAFLKFLTEGGTYVDPNTRVETALAVLGAGFLGTADGQAFQARYAEAIATAAVTGSRATSTLLAQMTALSAYGFWFRPSFEEQEDDAALLQLMSEAIVNTQDPTVTPAMCVQGNTQTDLQGTPIRACQLAWSARKTAIPVAFGDLPDLINGTYARIGALRTAVNNYHPDHPEFVRQIDQTLGTTSSKQRTDLHLSHEKAVADYYNALFAGSTGSGFAADEEFADEDFLFRLERSTGDTLDEAAELPLELIIGVGVVSFVWASLSLINAHSAVYTHVLLALWGVLTIGLATGASLGFSALVGLHYNPLSLAVVPFLAVGIGMDDMFVLAQAYKREVKQGSSVIGVMAATLGEAGPSVAFTTLINFLAFMIGTASTVAVVQVFCYQLVISVVFNFLALFTLFIPVMILDCGRVMADRPESCITCCNDQDAAMKPGMLDSFFANNYIDNILSVPGKAIILVTFLTFFGLMFWQGFYEVDKGLRISELAQDESALLEFSLVLEAEFQTFSATVVTESDDFPGAQGAILEMITNLQSSKWVVDEPPILALYWLTAFLSDQSTNATTPLADNTASFYAAFEEWLSGSGIAFLNDMYCIDSNTEVNVNCLDILGAFDAVPAAGSNPNVILKAVRGSFYFQDLETNDDFLAAIKDTRRKIELNQDSYRDSNPDDKNYKSVPSSYVHTFWDQYNHSEYDFYLIVGLCLLGVFIATTAFSFSPWTGLILCVIIFMIVTEILGLLPIWGVQHNAFSLVNLCISIAMAVEFTAHLAHQFVAEDGDSRTDRARRSVAFMGPAIFHGFMSSILATCFIAGSETGFIVRYFFGMFFTTLVISALNGLFFLPVVLSLVGPHGVNVKRFLNEDDDAGVLDGIKTDFDAGTTNGRQVTGVATMSAWDANDSDDEDADVDAADDIIMSRRVSTAVL
eukprot:m.206891 g.206891  ORF g.206891 m.206891 type:complete len:1637 (+) comp17116_c0_seq1:125-5035(+)